MTTKEGETMDERLELGGSLFTPVRRKGAWVVEIVVPAGASVSLDQVETGHGSVEDHRHGKPQGIGAPHFVVSGQVRAGSFEVRGAKAGTPS
jgi:hypothetical protein